MVADLVNFIRNLQYIALILQHGKNHHWLNISAIVIPSFSAMENLPEIFTGATGFLGTIWYIFLFYGKYIEWKNRRRRKREEEIKNLWGKH